MPRCSSGEFHSHLPDGQVRIIPAELPSPVTPDSNVHGTCCGGNSQAQNFAFDMFRQ
jgi:hypothetical protein